MNYIFLLTGYAGSGKTTAAGLLEKLINNVKMIAFADEVKKEVSELYKFPCELCYSQSGKQMLVNEEKTVRQLLIEYSYECKQKYGDDVWAKKVVDAIKTTEGPWIIHDWRYVEEYNCLKRNLSHKLITIRIIRNSVTPMDIPSEHDLDAVKTDFTINNSGDMSYLTEQLIEILDNV